MAPSYFPLRWESTGDQWWYAAPVDWAAANGHYDLVRELLRLDNNLLIKLTSLRRIRRLETVWDDTLEFVDAAKGRSIVARNLLLECENKGGGNSLIRAGYGGWLLYTAAAAGDIGFVQELLNRDPLLVFGEGEYGVTDIFYAAARSKNSEIFRLMFNSSISPKCCSMGSNGGSSEHGVNVSTVFKWEMMNRAVHAAARGGNVGILKELLVDCSDVLAYRDVQGSTLLHAAAGRGQTDVVKDLLGSFDIITSRDNQGNTALHVAAYRGHLAVLEALVPASPSSISLTNNAGDTFLHMAVAGFRSPGFRRLDRQIELMKNLVCGKSVNLPEVINCQNSDGSTALHMAVIGNIDSNLVELLMTVPSINLNIRDIDGRTPLDLLSLRPRSASSEILIKQLISAGGISNSRDFEARSAIVSQLKTRGISSPGTSFRIPDAEIFLYTGLENVLEAGDRGSARSSSCSTSSKSELSQFEIHSLSEIKKPSSVNYAAKRLKILLGWSRRKERERNLNDNSENPLKMLGEDSPASYKILSDLEETPTPLRLRFSKPSLLNNKRTLAVRSVLPSPSVKKKFAAGLMHGVLQGIPNFVIPSQSPTSSFSRSPMSSPSTSEKLKGVMLENEIVGDPSGSSTSSNNGAHKIAQKSSLANNRLMNQYFCFGAHGLSVENPINGHRSNRAYKPSVLSMA